MSLPLTDVCVVDLGGPTTAYCAKLLWDLGATVTVVEPPEGHELRGRPPFDRSNPGTSLVFDWYHGGSESVVVDPADAGSIASVILGADVVLAAPGHVPWPDCDLLRV